MLYDKQAIIYRNETVLGEYNRPEQRLVEVGRAKVQLSRINLSIVNYMPQSEIQERYRLFTKPKVDIKPHDIVEIEGRKYVVSSPPMTYRIHKEVDVFYQKEV